MIAKSSIGPGGAAGIAFGDQRLLHFFHVFALGTGCKGMERHRGTLLCCDFYWRTFQQLGGERKTLLASQPRRFWKSRCELDRGAFCGNGLSPPYTLTRFN